MAVVERFSFMKYGMAGLLFLTLLVGGGYLLIPWQAPAGSPGEAPVFVPPPGSTTPTAAAARPSQTPAPTETPAPTPPPTLTLTPTVEPVCGGPPSMTILVSGVASEGYLYGLADAVRVVRVDFQEPSLAVLALPRDLWVRIPGIADHGVREGKLNQAYFYGTEGMGYYDGAGGGSGLLAMTLRDNFGLEVDHTLAVNLYAFRDIVDAMGGVDVYFSEPVYIKRFGEPKLYKKAGTRHLSGKEAEKVVRSRIGIGDLGRIQNQTVVLKAAAAKMLSPASVKHLPAIVKSLIQKTQTDLSPAEIGKLICLAEKLDLQDDLRFQEFPNQLVSGVWIRDHHLGYTAYALTYDPQEMRRFLEDFADEQG